MGEGGAELIVDNCGNDNEPSWRMGFTRFSSIPEDTPSQERTILNLNIKSYQENILPALIFHRIRSKNKIHLCSAKLYSLAT